MDRHVRRVAVLDMARLMMEGGAAAQRLAAAGVGAGGGASAGGEDAAPAHHGGCASAYAFETALRLLEIEEEVADGAVAARMCNSGGQVGGTGRLGVCMRALRCWWRCQHAAPCGSRWLFWVCRAGSRRHVQISFHSTAPPPPAANTLAHWVPTCIDPQAGLPRNFSHLAFQSPRTGSVAASAAATPRGDGYPVGSYSGAASSYTRPGVLGVWVVEGEAGCGCAAV